MEVATFRIGDGSFREKNRPQCEKFFKKDSFENGELIGTIVNCSVDEEYLDENGNIDVDKMEIITFDMVSNTYRILGEVVGNAFKDGLKLKD